MVTEQFIRGVAKPKLVTFLRAPAQDEIGDGGVPVSFVPDMFSELLEVGKPPLHVGLVSPVGLPDG